jgi:hypothetical protein
MSGISCVREESKICKLKPAHQVGLFKKKGLLSALLKPGMDKHEAKQQEIACYKAKKQGRFSLQEKFRQSRSFFI